MRALALLEMILMIWVVGIFISLISTFLADGFIALVLELAEGKGWTLSLLLILVIITDIWRDKKRIKLIKKGKITPNRLF